MTRADLDTGDLEFAPRPRLDRSLAFWVLAACVEFWFFVSQVVIKLF